jgi:hypothetical protein
MKFEPINNYLTHGSITKTNVPVHASDDVPIEFNYVLVHNDQNDEFSEKHIDVYILEVCNPKSRVHL